MKKIPLTQGFFAIVDDEDFEWISQHKWFAFMGKGRPYAGRGRGPMIRMHRAIVNPPAGMVVDHINGDTLDNRRENLRACSAAQNTRNAKVYSTSTSGLKGAVRHNGKWRGKVTFGGKSYHLGTFETAEEAHEAYCIKAKELHGEYARLE